MSIIDYNKTDKEYILTTNPDLIFRLKPLTLKVSVDSRKAIKELMECLNKDLQISTFKKESGEIELEEAIKLLNDSGQYELEEKIINYQIKFLKVVLAGETDRVNIDNFIIESFQEVLNDFFYKQTKLGNYVKT